MNAADVSLVLLTKNGGALFEQMLAGLFDCHGISEAEVLMIDSGSTDSTLQDAARYPTLRVHRIPPAEFGHGKTRNLGARMSSRPFVVYLVQDAIPSARDFITQLIAPLGDKQVAGVYGRQLPGPDTSNVERMFLARTYPDRREVRARTGSGPIGIHDMFFSNVASAIRREVWERIPFDESLIMSEDQMWAKQVLLAGYRLVYEPKAAVFHSHRYPLKEVFKRNFDSGASLVGISEDAFLSNLSYELRYLGSSIARLARGGHLLTIPQLLAYEAARVAGFAAGQRERMLPRQIKRALSMHKYYWAKDRCGG